MPDILDAAMSSYHPGEYNNDMYDSALEDSNKDNLIDYFTKGGAISSLISAGVSFANTGIAFTRMLGGESADIETEDVIAGMLDQEAVDYYKRHREVVDGIGFAVGSLAPGLGSIRALKGLQATLRGGTEMTKVATGIRAALVPADKAGALRKAIEAGEATFTKGSYSSLGIQAFHQQALEAAAYEGAVLMTMNQNPTINKDDLDYLDAVVDNLGGAAVGFAFGTGIGGVIETAMAGATLKKLVRETELINSKTNAIYTPGDGNYITGDVATISFKRLGVLESRVDPAAPSKELNTAIKKQRDYIIKYFTDMADGDTKIAGRVFGLLKAAQKKDPKFDVAEVLSGGTNLRKLNAPDSYGQSAAQYVKLFGEGQENDWLDLLQQYEFGLKPVDDGFSSIYKKGDKDQLAYVRQEYEGTMGMVVGAGMKQSVREFLENKLKRKLTRKEAKQIGGWDRSGGVSFDAIKKLKFDGDTSSVTPPEVVRFTMLHEIGHLKSNANEVINFMLKKKSQYAQDLVNDLIEISSQFARKDQWDYYTAAAAQGDIEAAYHLETYLKRPQELLADAWSVMSGGQGDAIAKQVAKKYQTAFKFFQTGHSMFGIERFMDKVLPVRKAILNLKSGELITTGVTPTLADIGGGAFKGVGRSRTFVWGRENTKQFGVLKPTDVYDPTKVTPLEAQAHYHMRLLDKEAVNYNVLTLKANDLPRMTRALKDLQDGVVHKVKVQAGNNVVLEMGEQDVYKALLAEKDKLARRLVGQRLDVNGGVPYSYRDIARILDIDDNYWTKYGANMQFAQANGAEMLTALSDDFFEPTHIRVDYSKDAVIKQSGKRDMLFKGLSASQARINAKKEIHDAAFQAFAGAEAKNFVDRVSHTGETNFANNITSVDETAGVITASNGNYFQSFTNWIGKQTAVVMRKWEEKVDKEMLASATSVASTTEGKAHFAAIDTLLRQRFYHFYGTGEESVEDVVRSVYTTMREIVDAAAPDDPDGLAELLEVHQMLLKTFQQSQLFDKLSALTTTKGLIFAKDDFTKALNKAFDLGVAGDFEAARKVYNEVATSNILTRIEHEGVESYFRAYVNVNDNIVRHRRMFNQLTGKSIGGLIEGRLYPGKFNVKDFPHYKFVVARGRQGLFNGKPVSIIAGNTKQDLLAKEDMIMRTMGDDVQILSPEQISKDKQLANEFDIEKAMTSDEINDLLRRKGVLSDIAPTPSERMIENSIRHLKDSYRTLTRDYVALKYNEEIGTLQAMASRFDEAERARFGARHETYLSKLTGWRKSRAGNPYSDHVRQMLNINNFDEYKAWAGVQRSMSTAFNTMYQELRKVLHRSEKLEKPEIMNDVMEKYGLKRPFDEDYIDFAYQNTHIPRQTLEAAVARMNNIVATAMLRMDGAQALTDVLSLPVGAYPEIQHLIATLKNPALEKLFNVKVPNTNAQYPTFMKLLYTAAKDFWDPKMAVKMQEYVDLHLIDNTAIDIRNAIGDASVVSDLTKMSTDFKGWQKSVKESGDNLFKALTYFNDKGVQFSKFAAARMADIVCETAGIVGKDRYTILNTFVNRVHGNYLASQRPALFQGWGGQLIGLFQTFQFNMMQQLFRHIQSGNAKTALSMIGLQAGIFGAQSVPGFSYLNEFIAKSSNAENDLYLGAQDLMGKDMAEWAIYGLGSQLTTPVFGEGISLYTRGNLTPRTPILIPTRVEDIPAISVSTKFIANIVNTLGKVFEGAPVAETMLQGLAHNGANRPLQGLGQLLAGNRTTTKGSMLVMYHELNAGLIFAKMLGVHPLNEAIAVDSFYRLEKLEADRNAEIAELGEVYKDTIRAGEPITADQRMNFMRKYTESGGDIDYFGRWTKMQYLKATQEELKVMRQKLDSPSGRYMQKIMGAAVEDYTTPGRISGEE